MRPPGRRCLVLRASCPATRSRRWRRTSASSSKSKHAAAARRAAMLNRLPTKTSRHLKMLRGISAVLDRADHCEHCRIRAVPLPPFPSVMVEWMRKILHALAACGGIESTCPAARGTAADPLPQDRAGRPGARPCRKTTGSNRRSWRGSSAVSSRFKSGCNGRAVCSNRTWSASASSIGKLQPSAAHGIDLDQGQKSLADNTEMHGARLPLI